MRVLLLTCLVLLLPLLALADGGSGSSNSGSGGRCTDAQKQACKNNYNSLPICAAGTLPQPVPATCCVSCRPAPLPQRCTDSDEDKCEKVIWPTLPTCPQGVEPSFNRTTCCTNCRRSPPPSNARPDNSGKCSLSALNACISSVGVCDDDQKPLFNKSECCPNCIKAPELKCNISAVIDCKQNQPPCATGQEPAVVAGSCCRSCLPAAPTCTPACSANQICVRRDNDTLALADRPTQCRNKKVVAFKVAVRATVSAIVRAAFQGYSCDDIANLLKDIVQRFCSQNVNADRCDKFSDLISNLNYGVLCSNANSDGSRTVTVNSPDSNTPTGEAHDFTLMSVADEQLLADDVSSFLTDALNDPNSNADFSISSDNSAASSRAVLASGLVLLLASIATTFMILF